MTEDQMKAVKEIAEADREELQKWLRALELAKSQVEYWENQVKCSSVLAIRATLTPPKE